MIDRYKSMILEMDKPHLLIFLHNSADPDAIGSGFAFGELSKQLNRELKYSIFCDGYNQSSKNVIEDLKLLIEDEIPFIDGNGIIATLDTANFIQLGKYKEWVMKSEFPQITIDHHATVELAEKAKISILDENEGSTCIMVAKAYQKLNLKPTPMISTLLIMGHLYDSRRFIYGNHASTFHTIAQLIEMGGDYDKANSYLQNTPRISERIARLKANQKLRYKTCNGYIIATTSIGAFEASVARSLIGLGADVVLVLSNKKNELRGSARSKNDVDINIADIIAIIAREFGGEGGGHAQAAGFNIKNTVSKKQVTIILNKFTNLVSKAIEEKDKE